MWTTFMKLFVRISACGVLIFSTVSGGPALAQAGPVPTPEEAEIMRALTGRWDGAMERAGDIAEISLTLRVEDGRLKGTFDWPELGYLGAELLGARLRDGELRVAIPLPTGNLRLSGPANPTTVTGVLSETTLVAGDWVTLPSEGTFTIRRGAEPSLPYRITPTHFTSGGVELAGLIYEPNTGSSWPGVVFVHGSGDSSRSDGAFYADQFARAGIATLIYDKRGVGESGGEAGQL